MKTTKGRYIKRRSTTSRRKGVQNEKKTTVGSLVKQ
jgi:hypothetical protein